MDKGAFGVWLVFVEHVPLRFIQIPDTPDHRADQFPKRSKLSSCSSKKKGERRTRLLASASAFEQHHGRGQLRLRLTSPTPSLHSAALHSNGVAVPVTSSSPPSSSRSDLHGRRRPLHFFHTGVASCPMSRHI